MCVERARGERLVDLADAEPCDGIALRLAAGEEHDPLRIQDRSNADGDRARRDFAVDEEASIGDSGGVRQLDDAGTRLERRPRLVEADVAVVTEWEEREAEGAGAGDLGFVADALGIEIGGVAARDVRVRGIDVDVVEQVLLHVGAVTAGVLARDAGVFVEVERRHVAEAVVVARALRDDAVVHSDRSASCGESEHDARVLADRGEEDLGRAPRQRAIVFTLFPIHASTPRTMTRSISSLSVSRTKSASSFRAMRPFLSATPITRAGTSLASGSTISIGTSASSTMFFTASPIVSTLPANVPSASRAAPSETRTSYP